jgi:hypothetical protein
VDQEQFVAMEAQELQALLVEQLLFTQVVAVVVEIQEKLREQGALAAGVLEPLVHPLRNLRELLEQQILEVGLVEVLIMDQLLLPKRQAVQALSFFAIPVLNSGLLAVQ